MNRYLLIFFFAGVLAACKSKPSKTGDTEQPLTYEDFEQLFPQSALPYRLSAEQLAEKAPDSTRLKAAVMKQFLTDTLGQSRFHKPDVPKYYPLQYVPGATMNFFVVKVSGKAGTLAYLCFTDKKGKYLNSMLAGHTADKEGTVLYFSLDSKYVIKTSTERKLTASRSALKEDFYMINPDGAATLIMTNSNEPGPGQLFNPIDTLPRKQKLSGDYKSGEMNLVSIRDGDEPKTFRFFVSFSKDNGGCKGELSGIGRYTGTNKGEYHDKESACGIAFQFSGSRVNIREIGGCGAYRNIKCFFEGGFTKKKK